MIVAALPTATAAVIALVVRKVLADRRTEILRRKDDYGKTGIPGRKNGFLKNGFQVSENTSLYKNIFKTKSIHWNQERLEDNMEEGRNQIIFRTEIRAARITEMKAETIR